MTPDEAAKRAQALQDRLAELNSLEAANKEDRATVILDQQSVGRLSRMDALQRQAMAQETQRRRTQERRRIAAALQRIEDDEYGWCAKCGAEIPVKRLDVDPTAALCAGCAS